VESSLILVTRYTSAFTLKCILLNYNQKDRMNFARKQWDPVWNDIAEKADTRTAGEKRRSAFSRGNCLSVREAGAAP
jgi:hypothetical protein